MVQSALVGGAHFLGQGAHLGEVVIQHAGFTAQGFPLGSDAPFGFLEKGRENLATSALRRQLNAISGPGEGTLSQGDFHGGIARVLAADLRHLLIHRDGVAMRRADLGAGQEDVDTVVVVPQTSGMV